MSRDGTPKFLYPYTKRPLFVPGSDRASHSRQFLLAARFLDPENQEAVEALIQDLGLEFMGAEV